MRYPLILVLALATGALARDGGDATFDDVATDVQRQLEAAVAELDALREAMAAETVPLSRTLSEKEAELVAVRREYQQKTRLLDSRTLDLSTLRTDIKAREEEALYIANLLGDYVRNFESRLHIAELQRYEAALDAARLAPENANLSDREVFEAQTALLDVSLDRLFDALGGTRFEGRAVDPGGVVEQGAFVLVGPAAIFRSADGTDVGTAEQQLGSLEPTIMPFEDPALASAAAGVVNVSEGRFPLDPSLGDAHRIAATKETLWEHVRKGGPVMVPIFALAGAALLVALIKWLQMLFVRTPSAKRIKALLNAVADGDERTVRQRAGGIRGPVGAMLRAGVDHLGEPRDLVEEVMYETVLTTRLRLQRLLPFIAICAAAAPLLGLLGTVTGIINTFKLITVFGSGDVRMLSDGISEALITTKFGLIVAIPSLLLHAFLWRRARGFVDRMEKTAVSFVNQVSKSPFGRAAAAAAAPAPPPPAPAAPSVEHVREALADLLAPVVRQTLESPPERAAASPTERTAAPPTEPRRVVVGAGREPTG